MVASVLLTVNSGFLPRMLDMWDDHWLMTRILYIEDNAENRVLVRRILMASDYEVELAEASSALQGIADARGHTPDLILMDLSMPGMDGLTATQHMRAMPALVQVPIVALTANVMTGDRDRTLAAGCDGYIGKPIDVDRFADEVMAYLKDKQEST